MHRCARRLTGLALVLVATLAHADEKQTPAVRYAEAVKAFPRPSERHAFSFASDVFHEGKSVGRFKVSAKAVAATEGQREAFWRLHFSYNLGKDTHLEEAVVTRTLQPVSGEVTTVTDGEEAKWSWKRKGKRIHVVHTSGSTKPMSRSAEAVVPALTTLTAVLLFARLAPAASGMYEAARLTPSWSHLLGQQPYEPMAIRLTQPSMEGKPIEGQAGNGAQRMTFALDPSRRLPLWFTLDPEKGRSLQFGGGGGDAPPAEQASAADFFAESAKTAQAAALRAAYAFATADRDVLDDVMHWPGLRKRLGAKVPERVSAEAFRKGMLGQLIATIRKPQEPDTVKPVLRDIADKLETASREGGVTRVTFPERFATRWYDVVEVDGVWRLVGWPGN